MSKHPEERVLFGGHNLPGLTDLPKSGGAMATLGHSGTTGLVETSSAKQIKQALRAYCSNIYILCGKGVQLDFFH